MVKIKTKKQFTKKELIKYLLEQDNVAVGFDGYDFYCGDNGVVTTIEPQITGNFDFAFNHKENCLEMLVEEEVTEDTVIPMIIEIYTNVEKTNTYVDVFQNKSINSIWEEDDIVTTKAFHMVNQDGSTTLLWTAEGGMQ